MSTPSTKTPRQVNKLTLRDASAQPGVALMERLAFHRRPFAEDLAIIAAWGPTLCIPVTQI